MKPERPSTIPILSTPTAAGSLPLFEGEKALFESADAIVGARLSDRAIRGEEESSEEEDQHRKSPEPNHRIAFSTGVVVARSGTSSTEPGRISTSCVAGG